MSILIRGMEMPKRCEECACTSEVDTVYQTACGCKLTMRIREIDNDTRPDWCPLAPVPPHGRLIDGDKLDEYLKIAAIMADGEAKEAYIDARAEAKTMSTIIEAEEETE